MKNIMTILSVISISFTATLAWANSSSTVLENLKGRWNMSCKASKIPMGVTGIVPSWYENSNEINFFTAKTTEGFDFLNTSDSLPNVVGSLKLPLPIFYTHSGRTSSHTFSKNEIHSYGIQNEYRVCDLEFNTFDRWGGVSIDASSFFACSFQSWRNSVVTKQVVLIDTNNAKIEISTHFGNPAEHNTIECALSR